MGHPCSVLYSVLQKYTPVKQGSGSRKHGLHDVISFWDDFELTLFLWGKSEYVFSQWHAVPTLACLLPSWLCCAQFPCRLKATTASKALQFQDTSAHEAPSRTKISACWKTGPASKVWFILANPLIIFSWPAKLAKLAKILDAGKISQWTPNSRISYFISLFKTHHSFSGSFYEGA